MARACVAKPASPNDSVQSLVKNRYRPSPPVTAVRLPRTIGDAGWSSLIATPPYPDYPSGANNLTGAFTTILELFFNTDEFEFDVTSTAPLAQQKTRTYSAFSQAAEEVVDARVCVGIHFRFADEEARRQGSRERRPPSGGCPASPAEAGHSDPGSG